MLDSNLPPEGNVDEPSETKTEDRAKAPGGMVSTGLNFGNAQIRVDIASCGTLDDTIGIQFFLNGKPTKPVAFPKEWFAHELRIKEVEQFSIPVRQWLLAGNVKHEKQPKNSSPVIRIV